MCVLAQNTRRPGWPTAGDISLGNTDSTGRWTTMLLAHFMVFGFKNLRPSLATATTHPIAS